ncbi:MAG: hypothetical protein CM15mP55_2880 [Hyphomicrobiales bacterium]|nr:MAG: hypothetical protein CM15mP55_2880 [Hyphomicrobiales bacterium]
MEKCTQHGPPVSWQNLLAELVVFELRASRARPVFPDRTPREKAGRTGTPGPYFVAAWGEWCWHLFHNMTTQTPPICGSISPSKRSAGDSRRTRNCGNAGGSIVRGDAGNRKPGGFKLPAQLLATERATWAPKGRGIPARPHAGAVGHNKNRAAIGTKIRQISFKSALL